ncbi:hypothetical protein GCM10010232_03300 [Streptomyces amakusaensis]
MSRVTRRTLSAMAWNSALWMRRRRSLGMSLSFRSVGRSARTGAGKTVDRVRVADSPLSIEIIPVRARVHPFA